MEATQKSKVRFILIPVFLAALILIIDLATPWGIASGVPYIAVVLATAWLPGQRYPVLFAMLGTALTVVGFFLSPPGGELGPVITNRLLAIIAIWAGALLVRQCKQVEAESRKYRDHERKQTEQALRQSEARFADLAHNSPDIIYILDLTRFKAVYMNREDLLGYTLNELEAPDSILEAVHPDDRAAVEAYWQATLRGEVDECFEYRLRRKNGSWEWLQSRQTILESNAQGRPEQILFNLTIITERKEAEEQIKHHNILLEQAIKEKAKEMELMTERLIRQEKLAAIGQISGNIAHELRNPLGAIKQSIFYLKRLYQQGKVETMMPKVIEHLTLIEEELESANWVITNLLEMTWLKPIEKQQLDLRTVILEAAERVQSNNQLEFRLELDPEPFRIWADPLQTRQVLINLLTNAAQACSPAGRVTIRACFLSDGQQCQIQIQDNGHGIKPEAIGEVFEPLYTNKATGTGLGLTICKQIIENHGGSISLSSQVGQGTTVQILLPNHQPGY